MNYIQDFINDSSDIEKVKPIISILYRVEDILAKEDKDFMRFSYRDVEDLLLQLKPNSPKAITQNCYALNIYADWIINKRLCANDKVLQIISSIDRRKIWTKAKPNASKKFISYETYLEALHDIGMYEEYNQLYYQTLLSCLYEGIYCSDMSVLMNLRGSDVCDDKVKLKNSNGKNYEISITSSLSNDIKELSNSSDWMQCNRWGAFSMNVSGEFDDSCFKYTTRKDDAEDSFRYYMYTRIRKTSKEYLNFNALPLNIFISGIMYRIKKELLKNGISLEDAFSNNNKDCFVSNIISNELNRCNYNINVYNFREIVQGNIDIF